MNKNNAIKKYLSLRDSADETSKKLTSTHKEHLNCSKGCAGCCVNLTVFPVEFYAIKSLLDSENSVLPKFDESQTCGFLSNGLCSIYNNRPLICRTHGLPIVFLNDEIDPPEYSVSFCELNFTSDKALEIPFGPENTLNLDQMNSTLFECNLEFIKDNPNFQPTNRIPLKNLLSE